MSISTLEEISCLCGEVFEVELLSAISVGDNPELKEALISGEINLAICPKCGQMFYAECFILYHDSKSELIAFVYPLSFQTQAAQCREKMYAEFSKAIANFEESEKKKINYEPLLIFGMEDLVLLLKAEQELEDEEMILARLAPALSLSVLKFAPALARKFSIPKVLPALKNAQGEADASSICEALKIVLKHNPNLTNYSKLYEKLSNNKNALDKAIINGGKKRS
ncbi:MAG: CpXC domain-containing protein [Endomicrobium sp.]|jgi:hypothetical protein|nr:CpXC domain-containing protein [Endomicrobium sp.]